MSKTDKTRPWKFVVECVNARCKGSYPCLHHSTSAALKVYKDKGNGRARARLRMDLAKGVEPEPARHRRSGLWDVS